MSKYGFLKVGAISPKTVVADPKSNAENAFLSLIEASAEDVQVAVFPELFLCGCTCGDLVKQNALTDACLDALNWLLEKTVGTETLFAIGLPVKIGFELFDCAAVCLKGKILGIVPKSFIDHSDGSTQKRHFTSLNDSSVTEISLSGRKVPFGKILFELSDDITVGVEIGSDVCSPVSPSTLMCLAGANVILNLSASPETINADKKRKNLLGAHSEKNLCAYVYASAGIGESSTDGVYSGACLVYENGELLADNNSLFSFENTFVSACVDVQRLNNLRTSAGIFKDCSLCFENDYRKVSINIKELAKKAIDRIYSSTPFVPKDVDERAKRCAKVYQIQASALAKRLLHVGAKKVVLGISGGLDSTLALLVSVKAFEMLDFKKENIICITMPGFGTTSNTKNNSVNLVNSLGATLRVVDIKNACLVHFEDIGHDPNNLDVTYENAQARERTQILLDVANKECALAVGTGDLSEAALGWCTYNGDHMSMYNVNCDVPKTLIRHIVRFVGSISREETAKIIDDIIDTPISPELLPPDKDGKIRQKTEDNIGPYELHDYFLYHFIKNGFSPNRIYFLATKSFEKLYDNETIDKWLRVFLKRFFVSQFKRSCSPDGPKVGSVDLSPRGEWQMPSDARSDSWIEDLN